jgi:hypothetical protein
LEIINEALFLIENPTTPIEKFADVLKTTFIEKIKKYQQIQEKLLISSRLDPQFSNFNFGNDINILSDNLIKSKYLETNINTNLNSLALPRRGVKAELRS